MWFMDGVIGCIVCPHPPKENVYVEVLTPSNSENDSI